MELGNLVFGNSRGEYPVPRDAGWEEELYRLMGALEGPLPVVSYDPGVDYENDTFYMMRYYWGNCTCGWGFVDEGHERLRSIEHRADCYQSDWRRINKMETRDEPKRLRLLKEVYEARGWSTEGETWWHGCAVRCDCDYQQRIDAVLEEYARGFGCAGHKPDCLLVRDNFHYKPTGFGIQWYKYPLRDAYMNQDITLDEFRGIIDACIASVRTDAQAEEDDDDTQGARAS